MNYSGSDQLHLTEKEEPSWGMCFFIVMSLTFGMFFNEILDLSDMDEILEAVLILIFAKELILKRTLKMGKDFKIFLSLACFYPLYSITLRLNTIPTIFIDLLLQAKPYVAFFCIYYMRFKLNDAQKSLIKKCVIALFIIAMFTLIWATAAGNIRWELASIYTHSSKFYSALVLLGLTYLYCSDYSIKSILVYFFMISFGLITLKGKMYGFFFASIALAVLVYKGIELKLSLKNLLFLSFLMSGVIWVARDKILFYFFNTTDALESLARPLLYVTSLTVIKDYFPFGSGLASFGTHASRINYSELYYKYDLDMTWGLSPEMSDFVADTFFPSLAQYGIVGIVLFILFWINIVRLLNKQKQFCDNNKNYLIGILLLVFLMIELVADAALTNNRGFIVMMLLALILKEYRPKDDSEAQLIEKTHAY